MIRLNNCRVCSISDVTTNKKPRRMSHEACSTHGKDTKCVHFIWKPLRKTTLRSCRLGREYNIKMNLKEYGVRICV